MRRNRLRSDCRPVSGGPALSADAAARPPDRRAVSASLLLAPLALLAGCSAMTATERAEGFNADEWMQTGANRIANLALRDNLQSIERVQLTLYRRNPREWRKWAPSAEEATRRTWASVLDGAPLPGLGETTGIAAIRRAFDTGPASYAGDRVAALVLGWGTMLKQANGDTWAQTAVDSVNAENAFRAARNMEISLWLLASRRDTEGGLLLLSTEIGPHGRNLVADRELSKVVARLDLLAAQADEKYRRAAFDFGQNWLIGSVVPFIALVKP